MPELEVPGATLYYQKHGSGPLLLCISGANGDYEVWEPLAKQLSSQFTVAIYDRRGFSRSYLSGEQDYANRLDTDADDAAALIKHLSPREAATVLGSSSGAIVALTLLSRHPDLVRLLISHEPPAFRLQDGTKELIEEQNAIYDLYREKGVAAAAARFAVMINAVPHGEVFIPPAFDPRTGHYRNGNTMYWFEREMRVYPAANLTVDKFRPLRAKLMTVNGVLTEKNALQFRANETLARELDLELVILPGAHVGYYSHAAAFATELCEALSKRDSYYIRL